jgi:predicted kinase
VRRVSRAGADGARQHPEHPESLDARISDGSLRPEHLRAVARSLALLHDAPLPASETARVTPVRLAGRSRQALAALGAHREALGLTASEVEELQRSQQRLLEQDIHMLLDRLDRKRIRDLHGNLRCKTIRVDASGHADLGPSVAGPPGDVAEDVAMLLIELDSLHASSAAECFLAEYALCADDYELFRVLELYQCELGCRLAVEAAGISSRRSAARGKALAAALLRQAPPRSSPSVVVAVGGTIASGKSTLASHVADEIGAPRVVADKVRDALLEGPPAEFVHELAWRRSFAPDFAARVYDAVLHRAEKVLASGRSVVLDACFPTAQQRIQAASLAARREAEFVFVESHTDHETIQRRLRTRAERDSTPGGWEELALLLEARWEPVCEDEPGRHIRIDTTLPMTGCPRALAAVLPMHRRDEFDRAAEERA